MLALQIIVVDLIFYLIYLITIKDIKYTRELEKKVILNYRFVTFNFYKGYYKGLFYEIARVWNLLHIDYCTLKTDVAEMLASFLPCGSHIRLTELHMILRFINQKTTY